MNYNHYFSNEELNDILHAWAQQFPNLFNLCEIGQSHEARPIWLVTITNTTTGADLSKPAIWLDANIHATELAGTTTTLHFIDHLLEQYGKDSQISRLIDNNTFYIVPRINPDGAAAAMAKNPQFVRSGVRPYPWVERDEGLHIQDIDGDSRILQIRIPDTNGDWKPWEEDPHFMVKRGPAEYGGTYYRLLPEGLIDDYDGFVIDIARPVAGLDFNRNFPFEWRPESDQYGAGPYPASEPEINAVVRFIAEHHNINIALAFHTFSRALLRPFSTKPDDQMDPMDLYVYKNLGDIGTSLTGYRNFSTYHDFTATPKDITTGAFDDWMFDHFGTFAFTVELWDLPTEAGVQDRKLTDWFSRHPLEEDVMIYQWAKENAGPDAYVPWYPFVHPQLGPVELGGWNTLYTWRNPPHAWMQNEAAKQLPFIITLAEMLPHLTLHTCKLRKLNDNTWTIDLVVENTGYLPSYTSQQARKRQAARKVTAELHGPETVKIKLGKERMEIGHLEGRSNKDDVSSVFGRSPTDNRNHIQWMIEGQTGDKIEIVIRSERAGEIQRIITLE